MPSEWEFIHFLVPFVILVITITTSKFVYELTSNLSARMIFRAKGYRIRQVVLIDGNEMVITRIGIFTTDFLLLNGEARLEFFAVSNTQLDAQKIHNLTRKYQDDKTHHSVQTTSPRPGGAAPKS